ncbi:hypothetical protein EZS27_011751 [termite gut metagenome]|uniref:Uncharacterized protein n=1 Tax=termite gut metagenome TaxID=433724 RepID=A0A5J4S2X1_9ZZZZ
MIENEVIIVNGIPDDNYQMLIEECVKYAIISLPFTVDRMSIPNAVKRALNITKGKVAEALFKYFCNSNNIHPDFDSCTTPFWTIDKKDFLLNDGEWDIKNNFLYHTNDLLQSYNYTNLPALIPNSFSGDQWSKRDEHIFNTNHESNFLFTFLKNADLVNGNRGEEFLEIVLTNDQQSFINELYDKYEGRPQSCQPFFEQWFWDEMNKRGGHQYFEIHFKPCLIITAYANSNYWNLFKNTGRLDNANNFQTHLNPPWYIKTPKGSCNFLSGTLWTTTTNSTIPVSQLPSFLSLFPTLRNNINCAIIKS